jgi:hypothetical protein
MERTASATDMVQTANGLEIEARVRATILIGLLVILVQAIRALRQAWLQRDF